MGCERFSSLENAYSSPLSLMGDFDQ